MSNNNDYLSEEDLSQINKNQGIRNKLIDKLLEEGMPDDKNSQNFLVNLLNGSDSSVFNKAKLKAKKEENDDSKGVLDIMAKLLLHTNEVRKNKLNTQLNDNIEYNNPIPGETDEFNAEGLNYEEFVKDEE